MSESKTPLGTVLIVDDEDIIRQLGKRIFSQLGFTVLQTGSCYEALDALKNDPAGVRLAILDVLMPELNGNELAQLMLQVKPDLKILFSSGYGVSERIQGYIEQGLADFIQKPFTRNDIVGKVGKILQIDIQ